MNTASSVSVSYTPSLILASILFLSFLTAAMLIHVYNQNGLRAPISPRATQWALCARRFYRAAWWAAAAIIIPLVAQSSLLLNPPTITSTFSGGLSDLIVWSMIGAGAALTISLVIALNAVTSILPVFSLGDAISVKDLPPNVSEKAE